MYKTLDELTKIRQRESARFASVHKKLADYECFYCKKPATNIRQGALVCVYHYTNGGSND